MAKVEDLRSATQEDFWRRFQEVVGPDGLMTYRYLGTRADADRGGKHGLGAAWPTTTTSPDWSTTCCYLPWSQPDPPRPTPFWRYTPNVPDFC